VPDPLAALKMRLQGLGTRIQGYWDDGQGAQLSAKPGDEPALGRMVTDERGILSAFRASFIGPDKIKNDAAWRR
jgi:hypothetical protein